MPIPSCGRRRRRTWPRSSPASPSALAERLGTDPDRDPYPLMLASAAAGVLRATLSFWAAAGGAVPLEQLTDAAYQASLTASPRTARCAAWPGRPDPDPVPELQPAGKDASCRRAPAGRKGQDQMSVSQPCRRADTALPASPWRRRQRRAAGPEPPRGPAHHRRADARHAARGAGPDHRVDRAPDDRRRPEGRLAHRLGHHRLPAGDNGVDSAVGQARRPVRPEDLLPGRDRDLPGRLGPVGAQPLHDRADRVPRDPGPRRRRPHGRRPGHRRRHRLAPRARPLRRPVRRRLRRGQHRRAAARRRLRRRPDLALDLLHQRADRDHRADRRGQPGAGQAPPGAPRHRLPRHDRAGPGRDLVHPADQPRRHYLSVELSADLDPRRLRRCAGRRVRPGRAQGRGARAAAAPVPAARVLGHQHRRLHRRVRDVRRDHLPAGVLPGRPRHLADLVRRAAAAADGRAAAGVHRIRADHQPDRAGTGSGRSPARPS